MRKRPRSQEAKRLRRQAILDAAVRLWARSTIDEFTMADVARRARLAKGTLYLYFPTKEALLLELLEDRLERWLSDLESRLEGRGAPQDPDSAARLIASTLLADEELVRLLMILGTILEHNVPEQRIREFKSWLHERLVHTGIDVDVLVNDAGFGMRGPFVELDPARQLEMIQVNLVALTELTRLFVPDMVRRGSGRILNVASTAAFQPGPLMAVYCATKAYVLSFSEALAEELRGSGVTVTCVAPGATETGFGDVAGVSATRLFRSGTMSSLAVAEAAYAATRKGVALAVPGCRNRLLSASVRFLPIPTAARVARLLLENA